MLKDIVLAYMEKVNLKYAMFIKDLNTGELCCINEKESVVSASIIKLFIMGTVLELVNNKVISLSQRVTINEEEKVPYSIISLLDQNIYTIKDLIVLMIIRSDNTATNKLIDIVGMDAVNRFAESLGLKETSLQRKMMDSISRKAGRENFTSAGDVAFFLGQMYREKLINKQYSELMKNIMIEQLDESMMRIDLEDELKIAHKTGDLECLKHDAGIVYTESKDYIFVMCTWEAPSDNYARNVIGKVSRIAYDYFISGGKQYEDCKC